MRADIRVIVTMRANPGCEQAVEAAIAACLNPSRLEVGNVSYEAHVDVADLSRFIVLEHWKDAEARALHLRSEHFKALSLAIGGDVLAEHSFFVLRPM